MEQIKTYEELLQELVTVRMQLEETNDTIEAIRSGEVDALVVKQKDGIQLYTLKSADQTYRIFIEQMTEGAVTLSEDNLILYCNSQFASLVQLPLQKITGQSFYQFIPPDCKQQCVQFIQKAWNETIKAELQLLAANGSSVPVLLSFKALHLEEGLSMSLIITDLTEQKQTEQLLKLNNKQLKEAQEITWQLNANLENKVKERTRELEASVLEKTKLSEELRSNQERLSLILETMAEGVGIIDVDGNLTYVNPMAQKILGLQKNEILTRTYYDPKWTNLRLDGTPLPKEEHPMSIMMKTSKPVFDHEIGVQAPGRDIFYISINAAPIYNANGVLIGGVGTFMDVTNRRKSIQQKDEFISVASHELKTPTTTLKASLQILKQMIATERESPLVPVFLDKANSSLQKLSGLIDDLLNVSRIEKGQLVLKRSLFNIYEMVKENAENLQLINKNMQINISGVQDVSIMADRYRVEQVLANLLNNAIKYSPSSSRIDISIELTEPDCVTVSIRDYGIGIPEEKQQHLFDRYYRVDYSGNQYSGLGLGLYISNDIISKHNGTIGVHSQPGDGSTFWFTLPLL